MATDSYVVVTEHSLSLQVVKEGILNVDAKKSSVPR